jgi:RNase P subunit RPR2
MRTAPVDVHKFPMECEKCKAVSGLPDSAGTIIRLGTIHVAMRCKDCGHEWRFDMPVTDPLGPARQHP